MSALELLECGYHRGICSTITNRRRTVAPKARFFFGKPCSQSLVSNRSTQQHVRDITQELLGFLLRGIISSQRTRQVELPFPVLYIGGTVKIKSTQTEEACYECSSGSYAGCIVVRDVGSDGTRNCTFGVGKEQARLTICCTTQHCFELISQPESFHYLIP